MNIRALKRKVKIQKLIENDYKSKWCNTKLSIELKPFQKEIIDSNHNVVLGHWARRTGKSRTLKMVALYEAYCNHKSVVYISRVTHRSRTINHELRDIVMRSHLPTVVKNNNTIGFKNGNIITMSIMSPKLPIILSATNVLILDDFEQMTVRGKDYIRIAYDLCLRKQLKIISLSTKSSDTSLNNFHNLHNMKCYYSSIGIDHPDMGISNDILDTISLNNSVSTSEYFDY